MNKLKLATATTFLVGSLSWGQTYNNTKVSSNTGNSDGSIGSYSNTLAEASYQHGVNLGAGMSVGQPVFSLDYEYRLSNHFGVGAYGSYSAKKGTTRPGVGALGADFKAHVALHSVDIYVRPGVGVAYFDYGTEETAFFAPIFAAGAVIRVSDQFAIGLEHLQIFNWTSDEVAAKAESLVASVQFRF